MSMNYTVFLLSHGPPNFVVKTLRGILDMALMEVLPQRQIYPNLEARPKVHGFDSIKSKKAVPNPLMPLPEHKDMSNWSSIIERLEIYCTE
jgi:hypothetical protein